MHIVECVDGDFDNHPAEIIQNIIKVGDLDLLPQKGKRYTVIGYGTLSNGDGYELEECDTSAYGNKCLFKKDRFITISDEYTPNHYDPNLGLCQTFNMYFTTWEFKK